eukprot:CAMPEP_0115342004 /NCGR_PEP_ID=MMETSP0270-20121206/91981_1 /TAXON_ID=71861 /ORGANISM="Scrippsiella trochoidea, Strain CCMP3099" /LENGTH=92 /DNA_ID=CAMNT_0002763561 /DNA_START=68 /DNA_END=344 /DNA_ORIENTATION=+
MAIDAHVYGVRACPFKLLGQRVVLLAVQLGRDHEQLAHALAPTIPPLRAEGQAPGLLALECANAPDRHVGILVALAVDLVALGAAAARTRSA